MDDNDVSRIHWAFGHQWFGGFWGIWICLSNRWALRVVSVPINEYPENETQLSLGIEIADALYAAHATAVLCLAAPFSSLGLKVQNEKGRVAMSRPRFQMPGWFTE
jgi:hypothetical protein